MGYLYYGHTAYAIEIDDRPLAHLKIAVLSLLRAGNGIAFSFERTARAGSGRETLWINPSSDIRFVFSGSRAPAINEEWVHELIASARARSGMRIGSEPRAADHVLHPVERQLQSVQ